MKNRSQRLIFFLVVWLTMFSCISARSQNFYVPGLKIDFFQLKYPGTAFGQGDGNSTNKAKNEVVFPSISSYFGLNLNFNDLNGPGNAMYSQPADLYYTQSGFFCKREWELEKTTHIPFRFRLGSLADCNALEGKH